MLKRREKTYIATLPGSQAPVTWPRTVLGSLFGIGFMVVVTLIVGCCPNTSSCRQRIYADFPLAVSPKLLLRAPGEQSVDPQAFAYRSNWPSTTGEIDLGRITVYHQYWYNRQSLVPCVPDTSYNLFQMFRSGSTVR